MQPATHVATIRQNVDDFCADRISYAEFTRRQIAAWDSVPTELIAEVAQALAPRLALS